MNRVPVHSSAIRSMGYDRQHRVLEIRYVGGVLYRYYEVPPIVNDALRAASSKGQFVNGVVKPFFRFEKVP